MDHSLQIFSAKMNVTCNIHKSTRCLITSGKSNKIKPILLMDYFAVSLRLFLTE